ncbi:MAG: 3-phosphoshikimate 1-carboxyvinyltransferase, partial [Vallitaleaceae bacterium]|nr:3-phosphoshikimate 1-carboxyvinyltransferase [Vallitaleaceae bacterium]
IHVLRNMGGNLELLNIRTVNGEKVADIRVKSSILNGTLVSGDIIPTLIDEIPAIAVAAAFANGITTIKDAAELKVKETNRIDAMVTELSKMGSPIKPTEDGMIITGCQITNNDNTIIEPLIGATFETYHDHRIAMSLTIAALGASTPSTILGSSCIDISYPDFFSDIASLSRGN